VSPFRLWVRKRVPEPVRLVFVWLVDNTAGRLRKPGVHHQGGGEK
jgi:hypothetical protein